MINHERPEIWTNFAITINGKAGLKGIKGDKLTGSYDRQLMDRIRSQAKGVLVGANSIRQDNPNMELKSHDLQNSRTIKGWDKNPLIITISSSLNFPENINFTKEVSYNRLLYTNNRLIPENLHSFSQKNEIVFCEKQNSGLIRFMLRDLKERGISPVLCEGGPSLFSSLLKLQAIDRMYFTISSKLLPDAGFPAFLGLSEEQSSEITLSIKDSFIKDNELFLQYDVSYNS